MSRRIERINDEIKKQVAMLVRELKDPSLQTVMITVTKANTTQDLKYCKIYVSVMGSEDNKKKSLSALKKAAGFIKKQLAQSVNLRQTPELTFLLDDSLDQAMRIQEILESL